MIDTEMQIDSGATKKVYVPWIVGLGVSLMMISWGIQTGWTSPNLARLTAENSVIPVTITEASWLVSAVALGSLAGCIIGPIFMELYGYRKLIIFILILVCVSWAFLIGANSVEWIFVSQILSGVSGAMSSCFSLFIAEVSVPKIRGLLISIATNSNFFGMIVGLVMETYFPMTITSSIYFVECLMTIMIFVWLQDSTQYFLKMGNTEKAKQSAAFYCMDYNLEQSLYESNFITQSEKDQSMKSKLTEFQSPRVRRSIILIVTLFSLPNFNGIFCIMSYMEIILNNGKFNIIEPKHFVIYAYTFGALASILSLKLIDNLGIRILLMLSSIGSIIALIMLETYFYLLHNEFDVENKQWLLIISIILHVTSFTAGFSRIPFIVLSEIFPPNVKNLGALIVFFITFFSSFVVLKSYQPLVDFLGEEYVFGVYTALTFVTTVWALTLLPETKS